MPENCRDTAPMSRGWFQVLSKLSNGSPLFAHKTFTPRSCACWTTGRPTAGSSRSNPCPPGPQAVYTLNADTRRVSAVAVMPSNRSASDPKLGATTFCSRSLLTPPTQWITLAHVTLRVGVALVAAAAGGPFPDRDAVADGDLLGSDEDVLDEQPQHPLPLADAGGGGAAAQPGEEAVEVVGEFEVGVPVGGLGVEGAELAAQVVLAGPQVR